MPLDNWHPPLVEPLLFLSTETQPLQISPGDARFVIVEAFVARPKFGHGSGSAPGWPRGLFSVWRRHA